MFELSLKGKVIFQQGERWESVGIYFVVIGILLEKVEEVVEVVSQLLNRVNVGKE